MKLPIGLLGSFNPARERLTALLTALIASSCPITELCSFSSKFISLAVSSLLILSNGIPVHDAITSLTFSSVISFLTSNTFLFSSCTFSSCSSNSFCLSDNMIATSNFCSWIASSLSLFTCSISFSSSFTSCGLAVIFSLTLAPASSIKSIALSGRNLSFTYLWLNLTAASTALSVTLTSWCSSYLVRKPFKISIATSIEGSSTCTFWKRLSSALSFSMCLYSSKVVAPIHCNSPRANAGFRILDASIAPSAPPAPTNVWISSTNRITFFVLCTSSIIFLSRSSNSPRYLVPAITLPISNDITRLPLIESGTLLSMIACANPSTIAVLPTPDSPINTGLFFCRLLNTSITRTISLPRPITGSTPPLNANSVKSLANPFNVGVFLSFSYGLSLLTGTG